MISLKKETYHAVNQPTYVFVIFGDFSCASSSPVIVEPEVQSVEISNIRGFLILMSDGLYKSLEGATGTDHVNVDIASMVVTEFSQQSTLNGVAQAVVDKVVRKHHDAFMMSSCKTLCQKRDDITLLVRNIGYPLANAPNSPQSSPNVSTAQSQNTLTPLSVIIPGGGHNLTHGDKSTSAPQLMPYRPLPQQFNFYTNTKTVRSTNTSTLSSTQYTNDDSTDSTPSSEEQSKSQSGRYTLSLDEHGRIEAYVDFTPFYDAINELSEQARTELENEMEPKPDFETIVEERELESEPGTPEVDGITFTAL